MFLNEKSFKNIVKYSPIAAIDLCIFNDSKEILLGKRINHPAKSFFFVPGGRIRKGETLFISTQRILKSEINYETTEKDFNTFSLLGVFQHFYDENFCGDKLFTTHYIVVTFKVPLKSLYAINSENFKDQHEEYIWYGKNYKKNLLIHPYCLEYIKELKI